MALPLANIGKINSESPFIIGIDLGTTNTYSCFSLVEVDKKSLTDIIELEISQPTLDLGPHYDKQLPSMVYFPSNSQLQFQYLVGKTAKERVVNEPNRVIRSSKSLMGALKSYQIDDKTYLPIDIAMKILNTVRETYEINYDEFLSGKVVVGVPSKFNGDQIKDTQIAVENVFPSASIRLVEEPEAIALWYIYNEIQYSSPETLRAKWFNAIRRILIIDMGGGTLDVAVIQAQLRDGQLIKKEDPSTYPIITRLSLSDYTPCAGDQFDKLVANHLHKTYYPDLSIEEYKKYENWFLQAAERIKMELSRKIGLKLSNTTVKLPLIIPDGKNEQKIGEISQDLYKKIISPLLPPKDFIFDHSKLDEYCTDPQFNNTIIQPIIDALARLPPTENQSTDGYLFDEYLLTGGMGDFPLVEAIFNYFFDSQPIRISHDPKKSVAKGLVVAGYFEYLNIISYKTIGHEYAIELKEQNEVTWKPIISANETLPISRYFNQRTRIKAGTPIITFRLGMKRISLHKFLPISTKSLPLSPPPNKDTFVELRIEVNKSGALNIFGKRLDTNEEFPLVNTIDIDLLGKSEEFEKIKDTKLLRTKRNLTKQKAEAILEGQRIIQVIPRIDVNSQRLFKEFKQILHKNPNQQQKLKNLRQQIAYANDLPKSMPNLFQSFETRFTNYDKFDKIKLHELQEYFFLLGEIWKGYVKRKEFCPFQAPFNHLEAQMKFLIRISDYQTLRSLIRLFRYIFEKHPNNQLNINPLLELGLHEKSVWNSNFYNLLGMAKRIPDPLLQKMFEKMTSKNIQEVLHTFTLVGYYARSGSKHDPFYLEQCWITLLDLFFQLYQPFLKNEIVNEWSPRFKSLTLLKYVDNKLQLADYQFSIPKLLMTLVHYLIGDNTLPYKQDFLNLLKELIEQDVLDDDIHFKAQMVYYSYTKELPEMEEISFLIIENYLELD